MFGYMGKILRINLSKKEFSAEPLKEGTLRKFIGGRGLGAWILWSELPPRVEAFEPENKLIFAVGPLTGTKVQGTHKLIAQFKSPLTGTYFRSVGGGFFGAELKFTGHDAIVVEGKADKPTYVYVHDGGVEFRDASTIWGTTTAGAKEFLLDETDKDARMIMAGLAGEKLVRFSAIVTDDMRTASRGGGGAVMGSKNLKAIVVKGTRRPEIYDEKNFDEAVKEQIELIRKSPGYEGMRSLGTNGAVYADYIGGCFPTFNYQQEPLPGVEVFKPEYLAKYIVKHYGCYGCMLRCGKKFKLLKGPYAGVVWDFPEYETHWAFGGNLGNINVECITYANMLADLYGLDAISTGSAIAFAMELYEKGIVGKSETDGLELRWGDPDVIIELVRRIALRIGIGNVLAEGVQKAAEIIGRGSEKYAMHVKGLELPAHDPRRAKGCGLSMVTSPIGATHTFGPLAFEEFGVPYMGKRIDPFSTEGKGELAMLAQNQSAYIETGVWCTFIVGMVPLELQGRILYAATGIEDFKNAGYLLLVGERIFNLERAFNVREGIDSRYDKMPERIVKEPIPRRDTAACNQVFEEEILLKDYYKVRGWNEKGVPTKEKLEEIGLDEVALKL
jgi:aldehyde:ferredoxin oxidoreductase